MAGLSLAISSGIPYFATHLDLNCPTKRGPIPDCGSICKLLETTTGQALKGSFGKPSQKYIDEIFKLLPAGESVIVGDRYSTDFKLGEKMGIRRFLVKTGEKIPNFVSEKYVVEDLYSLLRVIE